ncbi:AbrB/MazE/SpoVT family DNA-binding domain-containing protein [Patescibacteria group bacterium]
MYTVSITSQGQISIPAKLRRELGLKGVKKANISKRGDSLVVKPVKDFLDLAGSFKTNKKPLTSKQLHDLFAKEIAFRKGRPKPSK